MHSPTFDSVPEKHKCTVLHLKWFGEIQIIFWGQTGEAGINIRRDESLLKGINC